MFNRISPYLLLLIILFYPLCSFAESWLCKTEQFGMAQKLNGIVSSRSGEDARFPWGAYILNESGVNPVDLDRYEIQVAKTINKCVFNINKRIKIFCGDTFDYLIVMSDLSFYKSQFVEFEDNSSAVLTSSVGHCTKTD